MDGNANIFPTTAEAIMRDRKFRAGFAARTGAAFAPDAWGDGPRDIWADERGWLFRPPLSARAHVGSVAMSTPRTAAIRQGHGPRGHLMSEPKTYDWRFDKPALGPKDNDVFDINWRWRQ